MPEATAISPPTTNGHANGDGHHEVTFPELVRAHHLWETSADAATRRREARRASSRCSTTSSTSRAR